MTKKSLRVLAVLAIAMFSANLAFAGNVADVTQTGTFSKAKIAQPGDSNDADIIQSGTGFSGEENLAEIDQAGTFNEAMIDQGGKNNEALISQSGNNNNNDPSVTSTSPSIIVQSGMDNKAEITQGDDNARVASIDQLGDRNSAVIRQTTFSGTTTDAFHDADISQIGNDHTAVVLQQGEATNTADVDQFGGNRNEAFVSQFDQFGQFATVSQNGSDNFALVLQGPGAADPLGVIPNAPVIP